MPTIYFYNVPPAILQAFTHSGLNPIVITEIPQPDPLATFLWYARTEDEVMFFEKVAAFGRKIILAPETLALENSSVTALLLRQNNVELYFPFTAAHIPLVFSPERHWFIVDSLPTERGPDIKQDSMPILFSGSGKDSIAIWGPKYSGKTSVALSLAAALSNTRAKVLLIDATNNADLLLWVNDPTEVITIPVALQMAKERQKLEIHRFAPGLFVLPGNPNKKIASDEFIYLLDTLRSSFDFILFDTSAEPDEIGSVSLQIASRILICSTVDLQPFLFWYKSTFNSIPLSISKMSHLINALYPSRSQKKEGVKNIMDLSIIGYIPVQYEATTEGKVSAKSPYSIGNEDYKEAFHNLLSNLLPTQNYADDSLFTRLTSKFKKGR